MNMDADAEEQLLELHNFIKAKAAKLDISFDGNQYFLTLAWKQDHTTHTVSAYNARNYTSGIKLLHQRLKQYINHLEGSIPKPKAPKSG